MRLSPEVYNTFWRLAVKVSQAKPSHLRAKYVANGYHSNKGLGHKAARSAEGEEPGSRRQIYGCMAALMGKKTL